ncbi:ACP S-malonyltransferase [Brachybacterium sp. EF45031]|uniref:ACP S-malonyltransferase n=1 Tax=Brachybacterium sillae TaxID=2810536 RepID=UPI00217DFECB|nr:ACP S-malonyltransferase [Brachybacterium sillae]MCS6710738.1 ACP S-malonyltransferase [Brachybacterium sillae]
MLAIVSPGQGAQKPGFLAPWLDLPGVRESLQRLSDAAEVDLIRHGTASDAETIKDTAVAQPLLVAAGILTADALAGGEGFARDGRADLLAGHSVGEVTTAALAGVLSAEDAMRLVGVRSRAMAEAAAATPTGMAAVVGGQRDEVMEAIRRNDLQPANINSSGQVVAAGPTERIAALVAEPPTRARVMPLQVAGAFHTDFMASARTALSEFAPSLTPSDPPSDRPLISNAGGEIVTDGARYLELIVSQVASPVDWEACMRVFAEKEVTGILELAPAGTLTGLAKRELKGVALMNLNTPEDLDAARAFVQEHAGATRSESGQEI